MHADGSRLILRTRWRTQGVQVTEDGVTRDLSARLSAQGQKIPQGVLVMGVSPGSPAERAGIRPTTRNANGSLDLGDIITSVAGVQTPQVEDLLSAVEERSIGEAVDVDIYRHQLTVYRNEDPATPAAAHITLRVQLAEREGANSPGGGEGSSSYVGRPRL